MRLKKREIPIFRREINVQEEDGVKKRQSPSLRGRLDMYDYVRSCKNEIYYNSIML